MPSDEIPTWKDILVGTLRRTGPASAELLDPNTGDVYKFDFAQHVALSGISDQDGREVADQIFADASPDS
jgi:hypothetical protein